MQSAVKPAAVSGCTVHHPPNFHARPSPLTAGVVLANPDLDHIIRTVAVRATLVVIAQQLEWVTPSKAKAASNGFEEALFAWRNAKTAGDVNQVLSHYTQDFNSNGKSLSQWTPLLRGEMEKTKGRTIQLKDVS